LKPTKAKELVKKTAVDLNEDLSFVEDVIDYYYSLVKKKIISLETPNFYLHSLGTLKISRKKLEKDIFGLKKLLNSNTQEDFKKVIKYNLTNELLVRKEKALEMCNQYYKPLYEKRYKNLESKRANSRGDKE
jgi:hypothetical protein